MGLLSSYVTELPISGALQTRKTNDRVIICVLISQSKFAKNIWNIKISQSLLVLNICFLLEVLEAQTDIRWGIQVAEMKIIKNTCELLGLKAMSSQCMNPKHLRGCYFKGEKPLLFTRGHSKLHISCQTFCNATSQSDHSKFKITRRVNLKVLPSFRCFSHCTMPTGVITY